MDLPRLLALVTARPGLLAAVAAALSRNQFERDGAGAGLLFRANPPRRGSALSPTRHKPWYENLPVMRWFHPMLDF
jgi:hypothetical protein